MSSESIQFELLFDAEAYRQSGGCPWTFFAYPKSLALKHGQPPDIDACRLLGALQSRGLDIAIWATEFNGTTYFACRREDILQLRVALQDLENRGLIEEQFCARRSERLFAMLERTTPPTNQRSPDEAR